MARTRTDDRDRTVRLERQTELMARGYVALASGDAGAALRLMAADRLAETTGRTAERRASLHRHVRSLVARDAG